jgi:Mitochondrial carrier protein
VRGMRRDGGYGAAPREYTGTADALLAIAREEGVASGWFKGIGPSLLKAGLAAAATFFFYEATADVLREQPWAVRSCERD